MDAQHLTIDKCIGYIETVQRKAHLKAQTSECPYTCPWGVWRSSGCLFPAKHFPFGDFELHLNSHRQVQFRCDFHRYVHPRVD